MSERKTRGRQRIPIKLIENKDDLLVSFSKRRVGVYKKASELSTLCGVDVGAIIFSPSGIPHSFFTPDFDSVVHGRRNVPDQQRDGYGRVVADGSPRSRILELNKQLDEVIEKQEREEKREKQLDGVVNAREMGWWEVPGESLAVEQVKEQIEWFQTLKALIKFRVQELKNGGSSSAVASPPRDGDGDGLGALSVASHMGGERFFAPPSLDAYGGGGGTGHVGDQYRFHPPPPPQHFDGGGGSSRTAEQYLYPPAPPHFDMSMSGGSGLMVGQYCYPPPSLNLFGGGGIDDDPEQCFQPPPPPHGGINHCLSDGYGYVYREAQHPFTFAAATQGTGEPAAPCRREE